MEQPLQRVQKVTVSSGSPQFGKAFIPFYPLSKQVNSLPADKLQEIQKAIELFSVGQGPAKTMEEATRRSYQFWDTQPVPKLGKILKSLSRLRETNHHYKRLAVCYVSIGLMFSFFSLPQGRR